MAMVSSFIAKKDTLEIKHLEEGAVVIPSFGLDLMMMEGRYQQLAPFHEQYPEFPSKGEGEYLGSFGVCDTPAQFLEKYRSRLAEDKRTFVVGFTHVAKDPENKGKGGGWRWHKWGAYVGTKEPQHEYLDDEEGFEEGVYCYHIYCIDCLTTLPSYDRMRTPQSEV